MADCSVLVRRSVYQAVIEYCSIVSIAVARCGYVVLAPEYEAGAIEQSSSADAVRWKQQGQASPARTKENGLTIIDWCVCVKANYLSCSRQMEE
uniref:Uncharacterized protein n=1 Tax=Hyaloperonospora arabidopsidis (strain Emoy2) TaxID=559515 RepID=M4C2S8_HYAAE